MANPQQPELRRSEQTPELTPDAIQGELEARDRPDPKGKSGPVPKANKPGSGSGPVQDKPDLDDFAAKLGVTHEEESEEGSAAKRTEPQATAKKATAKKATAKKATARKPTAKKATATKATAKKATAEKATATKATATKATATKASTAAGTADKATTTSRRTEGSSAPAKRTAKSTRPTSTAKSTRPRSTGTVGDQPKKREATSPTQPAPRALSPIRTPEPIKTGTARAERTAPSTPAKDDGGVPQPLRIAAKLVVGTAGIAAKGVSVASRPVRGVARRVVSALPGRD